MKSLIYVLLLISLEAYAKVDLPILGKYQLHQQLEGGCFGLSKKATFFIRYSGSGQEYVIESKAMRHQSFQEHDEIITSEFLRSHELGIHKSKTLGGVYVFITTLAPFNEGRGLHAAQVITAADNSERNVIVDATFEVDGEFLFANFRNTRAMGNAGAGKCILKRVQSN